MRKASLVGGQAGRKVLPYSEDGSAIKGATMLATLEKFGVVPPFNRPSVSNDNSFAESLFRACKYRPNYPSKPFDSVEQERPWTQQFLQ